MTLSSDNAEVAVQDGPPTNAEAAHRAYADPGISSDEFWARDFAEQDRVFEKLRRQCPVSWQRPIETSVLPDPDDPGFWAVVRHADIIEVSRRSDVFVSGYGVLFDTLPEMFLAMSQSFLAMDDPLHNKLRRLVSAAFTPRQIRQIEDDIAIRARRIVASAVEKSAAGESVDFVADISRHLPIELFGDMFGVPEPLRPVVGHAADEVVAWADPILLAGRDAAQVGVEATMRIHQIANELVAQRRAQPANDLLTNLVQAEVDGEKLSDFEIAAVMVLFAVAATDTTRHTASFAVKALTDFPDQRRWLWADFEDRIDTAVEEFLRWGSVVLNFRRTAVCDYELNGQLIKPGDKVVLMYASGNRDAEVFEDPYSFDLSRRPNPHIAFGGGGAHFCLGSQLAKTMLRALFRELHRQMPDFVADEPGLMKTNFMRGVLSMPFDPNLLAH